MFSCRLALNVSGSIWYVLPCHWMRLRSVTMLFQRILTITIHHPWYTSPLAIFTYLLLIALACWGIFTLIRRQVIARKLMREHQREQEINEARIGREYEVLVDGFDEEEGRFFGRSLLEAPESDGCIWLSAERELIPGEYVQVRITGADAYDLEGKVLEA